MKTSWEEGHPLWYKDKGWCYEDVKDIKNDRRKTQIFKDKKELSCIGAIALGIIFIYGSSNINILVLFTFL